MEEEEVEQIDTSSLPEGTHIIQISTHDGQSEVVQLSMEEDAQIMQMEGEGGSNIIQVTSQGRTYVMQLDPNGQPELTQVSEVTQIEDEVSGQEMATVSHVVEDGEAESQLTEVHEQTQEDTSGNAAENAQEYAQSEGVTILEHMVVEENENENVSIVKETASAATASVSQEDGSSIVGTTEEAKSSTEDPITLTTETVVVVNGKKCVLRVDPNTGQLNAYPITPTDTPVKRRRGRPRKVIKTEPDPDWGGEATPVKGDAPVAPPGSEVSTPQSLSLLTTPSDRDSSAAEGLLELSNTGSDGVRRSGRVRKRAKFFDDYETPPSDEELEETSTPSTPSVPNFFGIKRGRGRPRKDGTTPFGLFIPGTSTGKRGRGRPRRNPLPGTVGMPAPIPAFIIPSPGGQPIMMAPIQGLQSLQAYQQQQNKGPVSIMPKPPEGDTPSSIMVRAADGTTQVISTERPKLPEEEEAEEGENNEEEGEEDDDDNTQNLEMSCDLDEGLSDEEEKDDEGGLGNEKEGSEKIQTPVKRKRGRPPSNHSNLPLPGPAAVIQLPQNLLPVFLPKKEPIKIGLKTAESELEKLKCPKCDFQAYYQQQFQDHIVTHSEDVEKCKCCQFVTFDKEDLLAHFKRAHSKCICDICDFMAEHAYVIKRHMFRHNAQGCECHLCGKTYKDQYILKMHVKMVHMPAEVLFECNVCAKKFTRKAHLKRHLRIHDPEKPFKCPHCEYRGCERSDITKHLLIHEEPKHVCEVCGKAFRHIKNKELHVKRHRGQRDYKCGVCDFYGYTFTDIRKHIERKHAEAKHVTCNKCGAIFKSELLLGEHQTHNCELSMIEQALAVASSGGENTQTTIQIPGTHLTSDGQHITVDGNQVNITVEHVQLPDGDDGVTVNLTEAQIAEAVSQAQALEAAQVEIPTISVSQAQALGAAHVGLGTAVPVQMTHIQMDGTQVELDASQVIMEQGSVHMEDLNGEQVELDVTQVVMESGHQVAEEEEEEAERDSPHGQVVGGLEVNGSQVEEAGGSPHGQVVEEMNGSQVVMDVSEVEELDDQPTVHIPTEEELEAAEAEQVAEEEADEEDEDEGQEGMVHSTDITSLIMVTRGDV